MTINAKWERLVFILSLVNNESFCDSIKINQIEYEIYSWNRSFNRVLNQPTSHQIKRIKQLYIKASNTLNNVSKNIIQFTLKTFDKVSIKTKTG